jgi:hypothetical protein
LYEIIEIRFNFDNGARQREVIIIAGPCYELVVITYFHRWPVAQAGGGNQIFTAGRFHYRFRSQQ